MDGYGAWERQAKHEEGPSLPEHMNEKYCKSITGGVHFFTHIYSQFCGYSCEHSHVPWPGGMPALGRDG